MTEEHKIQNQIRISLSDRCILFRVNVGKGYTKDGRYFDTGTTEKIPCIYAECRSNRRNMQKR